MPVFAFLLAALLALAPAPTSAFWRMEVRGVSGVARIDPLVSPGQVADHAHIIFGGNNFGKSATSAEMMGSSCTSALVVQDKSAYWTPALYFQFANGSVEMVNNVGGMLAYYQQFLDQVTAFPEGFQMIAGDPTRRSFDGPFPDTPESSWPTDPDPNNQTFLQQRALGFNCLNYNGTFQVEPNLYRHQFPDRAFMDANCIDGLRLEMGFPSCGNGQPDSPGHKSHVKYPSLVRQGNCPEGFDVHYPFLMFETIYDTYHYAGVDGQFVLSTGDPTGNSYHGDFITGWDSVDFLQNALDVCTNESGLIQDCAPFTLQDLGTATQCHFDMPDDLSSEDCKGPLDSLPVDVPIQSGPSPATKYAVAGQNNAPATSMQLPSISHAPPFVPSPSNVDTSVSTTMTVPGSGGKPAHVLGPNDSQVKDSASAPGQALNLVASPSTTQSTSQVATSSTPDIAVAEVTQAPSSSTGSGKVVATSYITSDNAVIEMVFEQIDVTVTATATESAADAHKRHLHAHQHNHRL